MHLTYFMKISILYTSFTHAAIEQVKLILNQFFKRQNLDKLFKIIYSLRFNEKHYVINQQKVSRGKNFASYSFPSAIPPAVTANVASFSGKSGLKIRNLDARLHLKLLLVIATAIFSF